MNYTLGALWLIFCVGVVLGLHAFTVVDRNRRARRRAEREDAANERRAAEEAIRHHTGLMAEDDYGYRYAAFRAEVMALAAQSDSPWPYSDAVCAILAAASSQRIDEEWNALS